MRRFSLVVLAASVAAAFAGCSGAGAAVGQVGGREVVVNSDRAFRRIHCENTADSTVVATIGPRTIVVRPNEIEIDGSTVSAIPPAAKTIAVVEFDGRLVVEADRDRVYDAEF